MAISRDADRVGIHPRVVDDERLQLVEVASQLNNPFHPQTLRPFPVFVWVIPTTVTQEEE